MRKTILFGALLGLLVVSLFAVQTSADAPAPNTPSSKGPAIAHPAPVKTPAEIGDGCGRALMNTIKFTSTCVDYCIFQAKARDWTTVQYNQCTAAVYAA